MPLRMTWGNIANQETDAVVNAAYPTLRGGSEGVHGEIFRGAGREALEAALADFGWREVGDVVVTPGFELRARYILHAVAPVWAGGSHGERAQLAQLYRSALAQLAQLGLHTVAFPLLGADRFGFPTGEAMDVAVAELGAFVRAHEDVDVWLVLDRAWPRPLPDPQHGKLTAYLRMRYAEDAPEIPLRPVGAQRGIAAGLQRGADIGGIPALLRASQQNAAPQMAASVKHAETKAAPLKRLRRAGSWLGGLPRAVLAGLGWPFRKLHALLFSASPRGTAKQPRQPDEPEALFGTGDGPREGRDMLAAAPDTQTVAARREQHPLATEPPDAPGSAAFAPEADGLAAETRLHADTALNPACRDVAFMPEASSDATPFGTQPSFEAIYPRMQPAPHTRQPYGAPQRMAERAAAAPPAAQAVADAGRDRQLAEQLGHERAHPMESLQREMGHAVAAERQVARAARARTLQEAVAHLGDTFSQAVLRMIDGRGLRDVDVYKRANLDRKLFSKLRSDRGYQPSKQTAVALCVALELNLDDALDLLARAGYTLAACNKADLIAAYFIEHAIYDVFQLNEALFAFDQPCLGA